MTVHFDEVQRSAAMFAEALLGRPVRFEVDATQHPSGRRSLAALHGETVVVVPEQIGAFGERTLDRIAFRHAVLHQAGYELFGTRAFDVRGFLAAHPDRPGLPAVFAAIEERRVDAHVVRRFPGAAADVARAQQLDAPRLSPAMGAVLAGLDRRGDLHRWAAADAAELALTLCPVGEVGEDLELVLESTPDGPTTVGPGGAEGDPAEQETTMLNILGFVVDLDDVPGLDADGAVGDGELPAEAPRRPVSEGRADEPRPTVPVHVAATPGQPAAGRSWLYDEWDHLGQRYLTAWCRVNERPLRGGDPGFIADVRRRHAALTRQVRHQFARITPQTWRRMRRERDGGELDLDEVVAAMVDRRAGSIDDDHLHVRQVRGTREVAAVFLLDMSSSTSTPVDPPPPQYVEPDEPDTILYRGSPWDEDEPPPPQGPTVLDVAKESLAVICDALHLLGDEHAIYGFSGAGRDGVELYVAKDFGEHPSARTWARLAAMQPRSYTRMGPAIRHATATLRRHAARTRFLVVVSDGYPQDRDYGPRRGDSAYGVADTAKALEEAERHGIVTFCITVDPSGHDYLRVMCPGERYAVIDDVAALPVELPKLYRALDTQVAARRGRGVGRQASWAT